MSDPGDYDTLFTWLKRTVTKDLTGQDIETFPDNGSLWGSLKYRSGRRVNEFSSTQTGVMVSIRLNNDPPLSALDRLGANGEVFILETIVPGDDELVIEGHRYDELDLS
jgi:head-tail adaptor